ncbi:Zn-ribbon domain-containing OB-fold protein [Paraburkholderia caledonica]|uniref:Zn-ribbon domain-containing OB-fold protein n=1 Tax=Paraburkholderia caledonica TaxID=134536 RepID=UPI0009FFC643
MDNVLNIRVVRCANCGGLDLPTATLCARCLSRDLHPQDISGNGTLAAWTTVRRPPLRFRDEAPYTVCVVDLHDGLRITGRISAIERATVGATVMATAADESTYYFSLT